MEKHLLVTAPSYPPGVQPLAGCPAVDGRVRPRPGHARTRTGSSAQSRGRTSGFARGSRVRAPRGSPPPNALFPLTRPLRAVGGREGKGRVFSAFPGRAGSESRGGARPGRGLLRKQRSPPGTRGTWDAGGTEGGSQAGPAANRPGRGVRPAAESHGDGIIRPQSQERERLAGKAARSASSRPHPALHPACTHAPADSCAHSPGALTKPKLAPGLRPTPRNGSDTQGPRGSILVLGGGVHFAEDQVNLRCQIAAPTPTRGRDRAAPREGPDVQGPLCA